MMTIIKKKINKIKRQIHKAPLSAYVVFSLAMVVIMTIAILILTTMFDERYDTIYTVFISVFGGEILVSALIKIFKLKGDSDE